MSDPLRPLRASIPLALALTSVFGCSGPSDGGGAHDRGGGRSGPTAGGGAGASSGGKAHAPGPGSPYRVDLSQTSTSGLSSGAFMAVQFHVAFSSIMKGAAIFAGGPYACAQGSLTDAFTQCMYPTSAPSVAPLVALTKQWATSGEIDDPSGLAGQRVFLFGGADDHTVNPVVMDAVESYYASFMSASSIVYENRRPGTGHTMPTLDYGGNCDLTASPWIGDCHYDGAGKALAQIYGPLSPPASTPGGTVLSIPQSRFIADPASHSLADTAYAYVPSSCAAGETCRVHVAFHGCEQEASGAVGSAFHLHAGYNEWADTNHLIILYPQTIASDITPSNADACWDWWGYDSPDYAKKTGPQMAMVRAMLDWFAAGGPTSPASADAGADGPAAGDGSMGGAPCFTANNYAQVVAGRATQSLEMVYAKGSSDPMGLYSLATTTSLEETKPGYYVVVKSCP